MRSIPVRLIPVFATALAAATFVGPAPRALAQDAATAPAAEMMKDAVAGTMDIVFDTRTNPDDSGDFKPGSPRLGIADTYNVNLRVAGTTEFAGKVTRLPNLYSKVLGRKKQEARLTYNLNLAVLNPKNLSQKKNVGKWVGEVPIDPNSGAYVLSGGRKDDRPLRVAVDAVGQAQSFESFFDGRLVGKAEKKETLAAYTYKRVVGGKEVTKTVARVDPMKFEGVRLAKGPAAVYPETTVNGRLDYDYETGNYLTDGIRFAYDVDGKPTEDVVTGTIKWVEDPNRSSNGKGRYEFNLRFNEDKVKKPAGESAAFEAASEEDAFFAVDNSVPSLTGTIEYVDAMTGDAVTSSKVVYHLDANRLTKQQVMNFAKLWLVAVGPTNDE